MSLKDSIYYHLDFYTLARHGAFHHDQSFKMVYVLKGTVSLTFTRTSHQLLEHDLEIINVNEPYKLASEDDATIIVLSISDAFLDLYFPEMKNRIYNCHSNEFYDSGAADHNIIELKKRFIEIIDHIFNHGHHLMPYIHGMMSFIMQAFDDINNLLQKFDSELKSDRYYHIISYIRLHLTEHIMLNDIEKEIFISKEYISREFKRLFNRTFKEIQGFYRVLRATGLLINTNDSIETICFKAGFSSKRYFYKYFNHYYQMTPHHFRKEARQYQQCHQKLAYHQVEHIIQDIHCYHDTFKPFKRVLRVTWLALPEQHLTHQHYDETIFELPFHVLYNESFTHIIDTLELVEHQRKILFTNIAILLNEDNHQNALCIFRQQLNTWLKNKNRDIQLSLIQLYK